MSFLPLKNNSLTLGLNILLDSIYDITSSNTINTLLCWIDKHYQLFVNNQRMSLDFVIFHFLFFLFY